MKIYVASSWRCEAQPGVVAALRAAGHEVYDFKNPGSSFSWGDAGIVGHVSVHALVKAHQHPLAVRGFDHDFAAMQWADAFVLVLPCGRSAHLEAGWAIGQGKPTWILMHEHERHEPELMYKMARGIVPTLAVLVRALGTS